ncbi:hypothetical protein EV191_1011447 [Tamaricihabitans halophyticus]|uniref:SnoaL-like protein n=1 Tax=Tamaricihabitans halophyticus TaxID=1262583 RepID=A0A4R2R3R8_9PSEU|nr:nuclear transport factor 2 family protein [Tamaricihabitans halophyticus]TCP57490.1 hypothetical protein EV191_1011447 [Tamaricihabitans halophyticus]
MSTLAAAEATTERYRRAGESGDVDLAMSSFAAEAVLRSPLTDRVTFTGHTEIRALLEVAYAKLRKISFHTDIGDERTRTLVHTARIGRNAVEEVTLVRLDEQGKIAEATLFVRTLPGLVGVLDGLGPEIARRNGRGAVAKLLSVASKPLLGMVRGGDRFGVPLVLPKR